MAPAKCTLYSFTPVDDETRLLSATVTGCESTSENDNPNRKSFQMFVNCQITVPPMMGPEIGSRRRQKIRKKPAPSICAARISSVGKASKKWRKNKEVKPSPKTTPTRQR